MTRTYLARHGDHDATDQTVNVAKGVKLDVNNFAGDVNVKVCGTATRCASRCSTPDREVVDIKPGEQTLSVRSAIGQGRVRRASLDYTITMPKWMAISVSGTYARRVDGRGRRRRDASRRRRGDINVTGGSGVVTLKSIQGEVTLQKAKGRIEVRAVNEGMHLADISGDLSAETTNGSIILDRIDSGNVDLYTVNGNISYDGPIKDKGRLPADDAQRDDRGGLARTRERNLDGADLQRQFPLDVPGQTGRSGSAEALHVDARQRQRPPRAQSRSAARLRFAGPANRGPRSSARSGASATRRVSSDFRSRSVRLTRRRRQRRNEAVRARHHPRSDCRSAGIHSPQRSRPLRHPSPKRIAAAQASIPDAIAEAMASLGDMSIRRRIRCRFRRRFVTPFAMPSRRTLLRYSTAPRPTPAASGAERRPGAYQPAAARAIREPIRPADRIDQSGSDLRERFEHEPPLAKPQVRDDEPRLVDHEVSEQNQIQVERPRRVRGTGARDRVPCSIASSASSTSRADSAVSPTAAAFRTRRWGPRICTGAVSRTRDTARPRRS